MSSTDKATLAFRCVDLQQSDVPALEAMVDGAREISFDTFARNVDWKPLAVSMGYPADRATPGLRLDTDRGVRFHSGRFLGAPVYFMVHSAIEFVFRVQRSEHIIRPPDPWHGQERVVLDPPPMPGAVSTDAPRRRARP